MARYAWSIKNITTNTLYTTSVMSMTFDNGRQSYLDNYNGGSLVLTIKNQANESAGFTFGDVIDVGSSTPTSQFRFYVVEISYNDQPGNVGQSTATITCQDGLGVLGRLQMSDFTIGAGTSTAQFTAANVVPGRRTVNPAMNASGTGGSCSAGVYSGSVLNFINLLINTERTVLQMSTNQLTFYARNEIANLPISGSNLGRTADATTNSYQNFQRLNLGLDLMNQVQVQPIGLATQQATNATSVSSFGANGFTVSTVDATTTQGLGLAEWLANTLSDPSKQRFIVQFTDVAQPVGAPDFYGAVNSLAAKSPTNLTYRVPGAALDTTVQVIPEGFEVSATTAQTTVTAYLTPITYYQFFTLDSTFLGLLDSSRLGW